MFPDFDQASIKYFLIHREQYIGSLHGLNETNLAPVIMPFVENMYLATRPQVYPALTNGESVSCQLKASHSASNIK